MTMMIFVVTHAKPNQIFETQRFPQNGRPLPVLLLSTFPLVTSSAFPFPASFFIFYSFFRLNFGRFVRMRSRFSVGGGGEKLAAYQSMTVMG